jgi:hypothetical protein
LGPALDARHDDDTRAGITRHVMSRQGKFHAHNLAAGNSAKPRAAYSEPA